MKFLLRTILILFPGLVLAQDTVVNITPSMFDTATDQVYLTTSHGWLFRQGNDTAWAEKNIDITGWKKMNPMALSAKYAGKNGKLECWFRIKIKLENTLGDKVFGLKYSSWGAADVYVNGKLLSSFGSTGSNGTDYADYEPNFNLTFPAHLQPGGEYTIAIHFVDHVALIPVGQLKNQANGLKPFFRITGPGYNEIFLLLNRKTGIYDAIWVSVTLVLSLLFWFLAFQNRLEKNLRLIAVCSTLITLGMYFTAARADPGVTYYGEMIYNELGIFFIALGGAISPLIIANIFKRKISKPLSISLYLGAAALIAADLVASSLSAVFTLAYFGMVFAICIYYVLSSWKNLKGAQWAVVAGLLLTLIFGLLYILIEGIAGILSATLEYILVSGYCLSFPVFLMVYVAVRFREILFEVQDNANQVLRLSEEKKEEALNRQKMLEIEVDRQTQEIRANQARLIQSEKMASLGELTAGIAHEIQNPLNFVNNFSDVNREMLEELKAESTKPKAERDDQLEIDLINDLIENEKKINHHGKRADRIVKGMLEHSRTSTGEKQFTDLNVLCDEFMKLSYHGLRAKDKNFNAEMVTHFDEKLPKVNVSQQDLGRVLLNLFNNAFYTVNQKKKKAGADYKPEISVTTSIENGQVAIKVRDNGNGIPDAIKDKIMQPFFTTKPTGEGTGLGLSLSYDIVVKGHGGSITFDTNAGEFTEFTVQIPT